MGEQPHLTITRKRDLKTHSNWALFAQFLCVEIMCEQGDLRPQVAATAGVGCGVDRRSKVQMNTIIKIETDVQLVCSECSLGEQCHRECVIYPA